MPFPLAVLFNDLKTVFDVVMKILSGRPKDLEDVLAIMTAQFETVDLSYIRLLLERLESALNRSDLLPVLDDLVHRVK